MQPSSANDKQIGGSHYRNQYQHWDLIENYGIGYLEGCSSKYATRWKKKNGVQDVEKGIHYVEKLIELSRNSNRRPRGAAPKSEILRFADLNNLGELETMICLVLCGEWDSMSLQSALKNYNLLLEQARAFHG